MPDINLSVPFSRPSIGEEEEKAVLEVLRSGWLTTGKYTKKFEEDFSTLMGKDVISLAVNSNTSGMILAMEACGVTQGKAVITTPYTFVSTAMCARHLGADVYFADIEEDSYSIDPSKVEELLEEDRRRGLNKIVAIVPVHIAGNVCNMERIMEIARKYKVYVIEDSAHAFPSPTEMGMAGVIGDVGVFSFYVTKTITTAEGGMVTTKNKELAKRMTTMRMHGMDRNTWDRYTSPRASWEYDIVDAGFKFNLPDILSALGIEQLKKAYTFYDKRKAIVDYYNKELGKLDFVNLPPDSKGNAWHLYLMRLNLDKLSINRDEFAKSLQSKGIGISVHFIPLFYFTYWKNLYKDFTEEAFPNAAKAYKRTITIPLWPDMTMEMAKKVVEAIKTTGEENHG